MSNPKPSHRCAVCWVWAESHDDWAQHATEAHGATVAERCPAKRCPGMLHALRLPNYGETRAPRQATPPTPYQARDGTLYTPVSLWSWTGE